MGSFRLVEYTGKDSGKVLVRLLKGDDVEVVDVRAQTVIGFTMNDEEEEEEDD